MAMSPSATAIDRPQHATIASAAATFPLTESIIVTTSGELLLNLSSHRRILLLS